MTPPVRFHCGRCDRDVYTTDVTVVTLTYVDLCQIVAEDQWRCVCPYCHTIDQRDCTETTAELLVEAGYDHHIIDPPIERRPQLGEWTVEAIASAAAIPDAHDNEIWAELDEHLEDTDSGIIDWGGDE